METDLYFFLMEDDLICQLNEKVARPELGTAQPQLVFLNNLYFQMIVYGSLKFKPFLGRLVIKCSHTLLGLSSASNIIIYFYKVGYHPAADILCIFYPVGFSVQISSSGWL